MDTGLALFLASLSSPASVLIAYLWGRHEVRVAAKEAADQLAANRAQIAFQLAQHNTEVAAELAKNTAITEETKAKVEQTADAVNGAMEKRIVAEKEASEAKGLALGLEQARVEEKERVDQVKKR